MNDRYTVWAVILAVCLELGIFYLSYFNVIGLATTLSCGFAVGAVLVTALMLSDASFEEDAEATKDREGHRRRSR